MRRFVTFFTKKGNIDMVNVTKIDKLLLGKTDFKVYISSKIVPTTYPIKHNEKTLELLGIPKNNRNEFPEKSYNSPWGDSK